MEAEQQLREDRAKKAQARRMSADALGDEDVLADDVLGPDGLRLGGFAGRRERQKRAGKAAAPAEPSGMCSTVDFLVPELLSHRTSACLVARCKGYCRLGHHCPVAGQAASVGTCEALRPPKRAVELALPTHAGAVECMLMAGCSEQVMRWRMTLKPTPSRALRHQTQPSQTLSQPRIRQMSQMRRMQPMTVQSPSST